MTEAEKRAQYAIRETLHPEISNADSWTDAIFTALEEYGLQIVERPQRKALPDCVGWWWVCLGPGDVRAVKVDRCSDGGLAVRLQYGNQIAYSLDVGHPLIEWAIGPLTPPEG